LELLLEVHDSNGPKAYIFQKLFSEESMSMYHFYIARVCYVSLQQNGALLSYIFKRAYSKHKEGTIIFVLAL